MTDTIEAKYHAALRLIADLIDAEAQNLQGRGLARHFTGTGRWLLTAEGFQAAHDAEAELAEVDN